MAYPRNCTTKEIVEEIVEDLDELDETTSDSTDQLSNTIIITPTTLFETTVIVPIANHPSDKSATRAKSFDLGPVARAAIGLVEDGRVRLVAVSL